MLAALSDEKQRTWVVLVEPAARVSVDVMVVVVVVVGGGGGGVCHDVELDAR